MKCEALVLVLVLWVSFVGASLNDDLDSLTCPGDVRLERSMGMILDIKKSVDRGAELLLGTLSTDEESCLSQCCESSDCDLALYKTDGVSKKGHNNCYLVHCGVRSNCLMVKLPSFNSLFLSRKLQAGATEGDPSSLLDSKIEHSPKRPDSHVTSREEAGTAEPNTLQLIATTMQVVPNKPGRTEPPSNNPLPEITTGPKPVDGATAKTGDQSPVSDEEAGKEDHDGSKSPNSRKKNEKKNGPCGAYGCDGSGVVAVVVVAAVCTAIIIVVGAVLLKKVVDDRRRKKFRNVDYLINGMYT